MMLDYRLGEGSTVERRNGRAWEPLSRELLKPSPTEGVYQNPSAGPCTICGENVAARAGVVDLVHGSERAVRCADHYECVRRTLLRERREFETQAPAPPPHDGVRLPVSEVSPRGSLALETPWGPAVLPAARLGESPEAVAVHGRWCHLRGRVALQVTATEYPREYPGDGRFLARGHGAIIDLFTPKGDPLFSDEAERATYEAEQAALAAARASIVDGLSAGYDWRLTPDGGWRRIADRFEVGEVDGQTVLCQSVGNARVLMAPQALVEAAWSRYAAEQGIDGEKAAQWLAKYGPGAKTSPGGCAGWEVNAWVAHRDDLLARVNKVDNF